jgi:hypothetical protein
MATTRKTPASAVMARPGRPWRRRPRAAAARQALRLYEAELLRLTWDTADTPPGGGPRQARTRVVTARAALRAVGVPHTAASLRGRLRLAPEQEPEP